MTKHPQSGIAQLLAAQGRNGDSMLVHMTPSEVADLQRVAKSRGKSLTLNPKTGLPEANILGLEGSGWGAVAAGAGLGFLGFTPLESGAIVALSQTISSGGDFENGMMQGMASAAATKGEQMLEGAWDSIGKKIDAFKQGWNAPSTPYTKFTPTMGGMGGTQLEDINLADIPSKNLPILKSDLSGVQGLTEDYIEPNISPFYETKYDLQAPEQVAESLTTPTTIETTTEGKSYIPSYIRDNPLTRGLKAMHEAGNAPISTGKVGITSLNADQTAQLKNLNDLRTSGAISEQEFTAAKNNLFSIAGQPSTAEDVQGMMKLMTMPITNKRAEDAAKKLAAEEAANKAAMTPKPVPYVGGNKVVQVRNPKFGQLGQPMYLQYYAKAGEANAGGVREMTPTELTQYNQSGKFVPGAARGGLTDLLRDRARQRYTSSLNPRVVNAPVGFEQVAAQNPNTYFSTPTQANPVAGNRQYYQDLLDTNLAKKKILTTAGT